MEIELLLNPDHFCKKCLRSFRNKCSLTRHTKNVHSGSLQCQFCLNRLKAAGRPDAFKAHLKRCKAFNEKFNIHNDELIAKLLEDMTRSSSPDDMRSAKLAI